MYFEQIYFVYKLKGGAQSQIMELKKKILIKNLCINIYTYSRASIIRTNWNFRGADN